MTNDDVLKEFLKEFVPTEEFDKNSNKVWFTAAAPSVLSFLKTHLEAAYQKGFEEAEEKYYQPNKTVSLTKEYKKGYQRGASDMREKVIEIINSWHVNKGGYTELAHVIAALPIDEKK